MDSLKYSNYSVILICFNLLIFLFFPIYSFYPLIILAGWVALSLRKDISYVRKNIYFYGVSFLSAIILFSIVFNQVWDSIGFLLPLFIPLIFLLLISSFNKQDYSKWLVLLCLLYIFVYAQQFFPYYFFLIPPSDFEFYSILLLFLPIFLLRAVSKNQLTILWRVIYIVISTLLFLILFFSLELLFIISLAFIVLLVFLPKLNLSYSLIGIYWLVVLLGLVFWKLLSPYVSEGVFYYQAEKLTQSLKFNFIDNFSLVGNAVWPQQNGSIPNSYYQFYLSFGFLGLLFFLLLCLAFLVAVIYSLNRKYTKTKEEANILWSYCCSTILFFVLIFFKNNFISLPFLYFSMAFWGLSLGYINLVRKLKKKRI